MAPPGQKTLSRARRLKSAKRWLATYSGKNLVCGYKERFGVDEVCAVVELRMQGVDLSDARLEPREGLGGRRPVTLAEPRQDAHHSGGGSAERFNP